jgi:hypothetical protein
MKESNRIEEVEIDCFGKEKNKLKKMRDLRKLKSIVEGKKKKLKKSNDRY